MHIVQIINIIDNINEKIGKTFCWLAFLLVMLTALTVLERYLLGSSATWQSELMRYFHSAIFLSVAAYGLQNGSHVRVDVFYDQFSPRRKAWVNFLGSTCLLLPFCGILGYYGIEFVSNSWKILEGSREADGMPGVFIIKSFILVFCGSLALQGISTSLKSYQELRNG